MGRDAVGNVFVDGDSNDVRVTLVVADQRLLAWTRAQAVPPEDGRNPYRGLDAFYETDAAFFFGRDKLVRRAWILFQKLQRGNAPRILAVAGASGSGKSSLVRAGLLTELAREPMQGLEHPKVLILRPGSAPLERLAEVIEKIANSDQANELRLNFRSARADHDELHRVLVGTPGKDRSRWVIVIDQFEELFTECLDGQARTIFLENLAAAASKADGLVSVVLTLRSDFAGAVKSPTAFAKAIRENRLIVPAMDRAELAEAISGPADALGHPWPTGLVENLVAQAEGRAGALPLLQFALKQLWTEHLANRLDDASWSSNVIEDFLVEAADALFESAGTEATRPAAQTVIRRAFLAMVQFGEGAPDTRRIAHLAEIVADGDDPEIVSNILLPFASPEARLVSASEENGEPAYELAHEALIGSWDRLGAWLGNVPDKNEADRIRADLRFYRRLSVAAADWTAGRAGLWSLVDLVQLQNYLKRNDDLTSLQLKFVHASQKHIFRQRWAMLAGSVAIAILVVAASALAWVSQRNEGIAQGERETAFARALATQARRYDVSDIDHALLLAVEVMRLHRGTDGLATVLDTLNKAGNLERIIYTGDTPKALAVDQLSGQLATARADGVELRDPNTFAIKQVLAVKEAPCLAFSHDGKHLAICGNYEDPGPFLWDTSGRTATPDRLMTGMDEHSQRSILESPFSVAFSANDKHLVASFRDVAKMWDVSTGKLSGNSLEVSPPNMSAPAAVSTSSVSPMAAIIEGDLLTLANITGELQVRLKIELDVEPSSIIFSPKGDVLILGYDDGTLGFLPLSVLPAASPGPATLRAVELQTGYQHYPGHSARVTSLGFSPDGKVLLSVSSDGAMRLWDVTSHAQLHHPTDNNCGAGSGTDPIFNRFYASDGNYEQVLPGPYAAPLLGTNLVKDMFEAPSAVWLPGGERVISTDGGGRLMLWRYAGHDVLCSAHPIDISFSKHTLAIGELKTIRISDTRPNTSVEAKRIYVHGFVDSVKMDTDARLVAALAGQVLRTWDLSTLQPIGEPILAKGFDLASNGRLIAVVDLSNNVTVMNPRERERRFPPIRLQGQPSVSAVALSGDAGRLGLAGDGLPLSVVSLDTGNILCNAGSGFPDVVQIRFGHGRGRMATLHADGTVRLWNALNCTLIGLLDGHPAGVVDGRFSQDDRLFVTSGRDHTVRLWNALEGEPVGPPMLQDSLVRRVGFDDKADNILLSAVHDRQYAIPISEDALTQRACKIAGRSLSTEEWNQSLSNLPYHTTCLGKPVAKRPTAPQSHAPDNVAITPEEEVRLLAKQGDLEAALAKAIRFEASGTPGIPSESELRRLAFESLIDDAKEHFEYERDQEALETLKQAAATQAQRGYNPQAVFEHWTALRRLVEAQNFADRGDREHALAALAAAVSLDPAVTLRAAEVKQSIEEKIVVSRAVVAIANGDHNTALAILRDARAQSPAAHGPDDQSVAGKIIGACRDKIAELISERRETDAIAIIDELVTVFPQLKSGLELLIARMPSISARGDMRAFVEKPYHKAFALGSGGWGWSSEYSDIKGAEDAAIAACLEHGSDCHLYAVDDNPAPINSDPKKTTH